MHMHTEEGIKTRRQSQLDFAQENIQASDEYLSLCKNSYNTQDPEVVQKKISSHQVSRLYDLKKKYLKQQEPRRSVSQNNRPTKTERVTKCFSPKQENNCQQSMNQALMKKSTKPSLRSNLRNILKSNFQQASYEDNPENEIIRKEFTQLLEIPFDQQSLENYLIFKTLGQGATAEVKMGKHKALEVQVAIKIYDKKKMNSQTVKNLQREVDILLQLRHPNIIRLYHMVDSERHIHLIMEYSSPTCLETFLKGRPFKRVSEDEAKIIFKQIVDAICYMHSEDIIHRDIKLENILIDLQSKKIKIIDFGYSIKYDVNFKPQVSCGTPSYMSPELIKKQYYDHAVDVWAAGILLYKLVTGAFPFRGSSEKDLYKKITLGKYEYPSFLSFGVKQLINLMLREKDRINIFDLQNHQWLQ